MSEVLRIRILILGFRLVISRCRVSSGRVSGPWEASLAQISSTHTWSKY